MDGLTDTPSLTCFVCLGDGPALWIDAGRSHTCLHAGEKLVYNTLCSSFFTGVPSLTPFSVFLSFPLPAAHLLGEKNLAPTRLGICWRSFFAFDYLFGRRNCSTQYLPTFFFPYFLCFILLEASPWKNTKWGKIKENKDSACARQLTWERLRLHESYPIFAIVPRKLLVLNTASIL